MMLEGLKEIKRLALAGKMPELAWLGFRLINFPGLDDNEAKNALGEWAAKNGIEPSFFTSNVNDREVLFVKFSPK